MRRADAGLNVSTAVEMSLRPTVRGRPAIPRGWSSPKRSPEPTSCACAILAWVTGRPENLVSHHLRTRRPRVEPARRSDGALRAHAAGRTLLGAVLATGAEVP